MADEPAKGAAADPTAAKASVADDAEDAASGLRSNARWVASALAAIPSVTILATLLKPPEGDQFNQGRLFWAIAFATAGVLVGLTAFARVLRPGEAKKSDIDGFDMSRLPDSPFASIDELRNSTHNFAEAVAHKQIKVADAEARAAYFKAASDEAKSALEAVEKHLKENPSDQALQELAATKRAEWSSLSLTAGTEAALAASAARSLKETQAQLRAREAMLNDVYRLKTADLVGGRHRDAMWAAWVAAALIALGLFLLLTSTEERKPFEATLVRLTLEDPGKELLDCEAPVVYGIQVANTDNGPKVITLPEGDCVSKTVIWKTSKEGEKDLGTLEIVETAEGS